MAYIKIFISFLSLVIFFLLEKLLNREGVFVICQRFYLIGAFLYVSHFYGY
jgi:hypothetical protein